MTTAQLRNLAMDAERLLNWSDAARLWNAAVAAYPVNHNSSLHSLDLSRMKARANSCAAQAREA